MFRAFAVGRPSHSRRNPKPGTSRWGETSACGIFLMQSFSSVLLEPSLGKGMLNRQRADCQIAGAPLLKRSAHDRVPQAGDSEQLPHVVILTPSAQCNANAADIGIQRHCLCGST